MKSACCLLAAAFCLFFHGAPSYATTGAPNTYIVQTGDTLGSLARRFHVPPAALARANSLPEGQAVLAPGQVLNIPEPAAGERGWAVAPAAAASLAWAYPRQLNHLGTPRVVLGDYMMWYSPEAFDGSLTFDIPAAGPYHSSDPATIERHLNEARQACLDGFTPHWYGPFDPVTTNTFEALLGASEGTAFRHALVLLTNMWPGANEQTLIDAIQYAIDHWVQHPNYLRLGGRPVLLFTDMPRPWGSDTTALAGWTRIRAATDPNHRLIWMAEGLYTLYNPLFDGLYVYRIDHRDFPQSWLKQPRFAAALRGVERLGDLPRGGLYWADTIAPGYDDTRAVNAPADLRAPAPPFARDRRDGAYYAETFAVTAETNGDLLLVKSFNEWVEGTAIEPGRGYGTRYLEQTCTYANTFRTR